MVPAEPVAETKAASRRLGPRAADVLEDAPERPAGDLVVGEVVAELAELVEDEVGRVRRPAALQAS